MAAQLGHDHIDWLARLPHPVTMALDGFGRRGAHWTLLADGAVSLRRTTYDPDAACAAICGQSSYPDVVEWTDYYNVYFGLEETVLTGCGIIY